MSPSGFIVGIDQAEAVEEAEGTTRRGGRRQRFTLEQKRQIVEATLAPGASVARVAREVGVNANQVFAWRRSTSKVFWKSAAAV
jgi:hypothetical protein